MRLANEGSVLAGASLDVVMRTLLCGVVVVLLCVAAQAADRQVVIYDQDPEHLWNRLYLALAVRTEAGTQYGIDNSVPFDEDFDDPEKLAAVLDEFLNADGQDLASGNLRRALLLHDVWAAFDLAARRDRKDLRLRLARVIGQLRMHDQAIAGLHDNYAEAVKSGSFAKDFDPVHPEMAFLPPDLFDMNGPWVQIGESGQGLVAPVHVQALSGRSAFRVFIRCPGGRKATLAYLERLNLYRTPWAHKPARIGITEPEGHRLRWEPQLDLATPQFPEGTMVALVRQMAAINDKIDPVMTPITQSVQFRVFRKVDTTGYRDWRSDFAESQFVYEVAMRRRDLLAGRSGGLHQVAPDEAEYQLIGGLHGTRAVQLRGSVVLSTCARCHTANGIFSVNTYTHMLGPATINPQLLPADSADYQGRATTEWKVQQFDWGLLRGLLEREE
jgi:hypothetical protein